MADKVDNKKVVGMREIVVEYDGSLELDEEGSNVCEKVDDALDYLDLRGLAMQALDEYASECPGKFRVTIRE